MKKTVKCGAANGCYQLLNAAKLGGISNESKMDVLKVLRALRPVARELEEEHDTAVGKLKPDGYDDRLRAAQQYEAEQKDGKTPAMTAVEYIGIIQEIRQFETGVRSYESGLLAKEVEVDLPALGEDVLIELMTTNGWTAGQMMAVEDIAGKE